MREAAALQPDAGAASEVRILYQNWRGETAYRRIRLRVDRHGRLDLATSLWFGSTQWHPEPQWLLNAEDVEKGELRDFAMSGIRGWGDAAAEQVPTQSAAGGEVTDPVRRERAACAHVAECHSGLWDGATVEAIAEAIRERGRAEDDVVLVTREAWATVQPVWLLLRHGQPLPPELSERIAAASVALMTSAPPEVVR